MVRQGHAKPAGRAAARLRDPGSVHRAGPFHATTSATPVTYPVKISVLGMLSKHKQSPYCDNVSRIAP